MSASVAVVGAGPNGLTAAARLAAAGCAVDVYEQSDTPGGASRSGPVLGEGTVVDLGAATHPFGAESPAFRELGLERHGLEWLRARYPLAHPLDGGRAVVLHRDPSDMAAELGDDAGAWRRVHGGFARAPRPNMENILGPLLRVPPHPLHLARFGPLAPWPASTLAKAAFRGAEARALFAGSSTHAVLPPSHPLTAAFGLVFGALGHANGWPVARGGSQAVVDALVGALTAHGGRIHTGTPVRDLRDLPRTDAVLLDLTPRQVLGLRGTGLGPRYRASLGRWRYGTAVHKVDYLLDGPVPWADPRAAEAGTVHVGGTLEEITLAEREAARGRLPRRPFILACQQDAADPGRSGGGRRILWAYAHVPHGGAPGAGDLVDAQIERFAPDFRDRILHRVETPPAALEAWNPNLVGGAIGGGSLDGLQQVFRPVPRLDPYRTDAPGLYLCSSSTPPGGGVHGMAGWNAAGSVLAQLRG